MKRQVRFGVFETNSSMTHSLTICTKEEFEKWQNGEILYGRWNEDFKTPEEVKTLDEWEQGEYVSSEEYDDDDYFEHYEEHFTTPSGDEMVAFGYYGHD